MRFLKNVLMIVSAAALVACGGGGGADGGGGVANNPLEKYVGVYYACNINGNWSDRDVYTIQSIGSNQLTIAYKNEYFSNNNCIGSSVATETDPAVSTVTYVSQVSVTPPRYTIFPSSDLGERVTFSVPARTLTLTGSVVNQRCVDLKLPNTSPVCIDSLVRSAETGEGVMYKFGQFFFVYIGGTTQAFIEGGGSTDPNFRESSLVPR